MSTNGGTESADSPYQLQLFSNLPLYTTQLVCETRFPFCDRLQVSAPADVVPILQEYFRLKDREEMILVLLDTANTILGLSLVSVGGLDASIVEPRQVIGDAQFGCRVHDRRDPRGRPHPVSAVRAAVRPSSDRVAVTYGDSA